MRIRHVVLWLAISVEAGCAGLPRVTLAASSSFRTRQAPYRRSALLNATATLGWSVETDTPALSPPESSDLEAQPWNDSPASCTPGALCGWERRARNQALARVGLPVEGPNP